MLAIDVGTSHLGVELIFILGSSSSEPVDTASCLCKPTHATMIKKLTYGARYWWNTRVVMREAECRERDSQSEPAKSAGTTRKQKHLEDTRLSIGRCKQDDRQQLCAVLGCKRWWRVPTCMYSISGRKRPPPKRGIADDHV